MQIDSIQGASALQQAMVHQQINTAVLKRAHDLEKSQGEALAGLLQQAAQATDPPSENAAIDLQA